MMTVSEAERLKILDGYRVWGTPPDAGLDRLTKLAANHFQAPVALISLVGRDSQWFKSRVGLAVCETSRDVSFCAHAIAGSEVMLIPDALEDPRFSQNPLVTGPPFIRFYAGAPLEVQPGVRFGSLCVIDDVPRPLGLSESDLEFLTDLAALAVDKFDNYLNRNLFEANPAAVFIIDRETLAFLSCNIAASNLLQYTQREFEGMTLPDLTGAEKIAALTEGDSRMPWRLVTKGGQEILALVTSRSISFLGRDAMMSILTDITEMTATQRRLQAALESSETALEAKSQFLSTLSHELRTPLAQIIGMGSILADTNLDAEQRECVEVISASGERLKTMISDLLEYSNAKSRGDAHLIIFSPRSVVSAMVAKWSTECAQKGVALTSGVAEEVPAQVIGNEAEIIQVLDRLVGNAVKFTPSGEIQIHLSANEAPEEKSISLHFRVSDSGIGIPDELRPYLFTPFSQGDTSNTRRFGGTGMGLAICHRIVTQLEGSIGFASNSKGSDFWFSVPVLVT